MWPVIFLALVDLYILTQTGKTRIKVNSPEPVSDGKKWTVYGTMSCGWTRKQIDYMKSKNIPHEFIDCSTGKCGENIEAFPTLVSPAGEHIVGYKQV